jgi:hypothetical protein
LFDAKRTGRRFVITGAFVGALTLGAVTAHGATGLFDLVAAELPADPSASPDPSVDPTPSPDPSVDPTPAPSVDPTPAPTDPAATDGTTADATSGTDGTEAPDLFEVIPGANGQGDEHRSDRATESIHKHAVGVLTRNHERRAERSAQTQAADGDTDEDEGTEVDSDAGSGSETDVETDSDATDGSGD